MIGPPWTSRHMRSSGSFRRYAAPPATSTMCRMISTALFAGITFASPARARPSCTPSSKRAPDSTSAQWRQITARAVSSSISICAKDAWTSGSDAFPCFSTAPLTNSMAPAAIPRYTQPKVGIEAVLDREVVRLRRAHPERVPGLHELEAVGLLRRAEQHQPRPRLRVVVAGREGEVGRHHGVRAEDLATVDAVTALDLLRDRVRVHQVVRDAGLRRERGPDHVSRGDVAEEMLEPLVLRVAPDRCPLTDRGDVH